MATPEPRTWTPEENISSETFPTSAAAKNALFEYAIRNGFALVTKDSCSSSVTLACAQGGEKRSHSAGGQTPSTSLRPLRMKKIECRYEVKLVRSGRDHQSWGSIRSPTAHSNHDPLPPERISALPAVRRFLKKKHGIFEKIEEAYDPRVPASAVWDKLRQVYAWLTFKDVDNIISVIRKKRLDGLTKIEALHKKLKNEAVISDSLRDDQNRLVRLFFSLIASRQLILANPGVLMPDCTYKTNARMMPLLHVVGVTGTHKQFTVACCFMDNERVESYVWALERTTRSLACSPAVAVVDNENALINALELVWLQCNVHLCRWHIAKNIAANCEKPRMQRDAFKALMKGWNSIIKIARSEPEFFDRWNRLKSDLIEGDSNEVRAWLHPDRDEYTVQCLFEAFGYIDSNKIPLRHRFASFAIDQHQHFANTSTSRAEGAHWTSIKRNLRRARGTLLEVYERIDLSTKQRKHMIEDQIARESVEILTLPSHIFEPILRTVTHHALKIVHDEYKKALHPDDLQVCTNYHERVMGLPCAHKLMRILNNGTQLSTTDFHQHWRKVGAVGDPDIHGVLNPYRVERTRGRPTKPNKVIAELDNSIRGHNRKTKRQPSAFEVSDAEKSRTSRKCGNCNQPGHNKRRCPHPHPPNSTDC